MSLIAELKRRKLAQWTLGYAAGAWAVLQALSLLIGAYHWPDAVLRIAIVVVAAGFFVTLVLAWYHGERGAQRLSRNEMLLLAILIALGGGLLWRTVHEPQPAPSLAAAAPVSGASLTAIPEIANDPSIAVLPFVNMSSDKEQEYFSDGISEELLNLLAKVPKLRVIARTSSFSFKGKEVAIPDIARALNVAAILEGSVRKSGDTVRITVQLIRASDSSRLWSETYDRKLDDIFKVQDEIAATVVVQLKIKLLGAAPTSKVIDPKAYALFLQAREVSRQNSAMAYEQSISLYQQALALDPDYAAAWVGLAGNYSAQVYQYVRPAGEAIPLFFHERWSAAVLPFQLLCSVGAIMVVTSAFHQMLAAMGRPDVTLKYNLVCALVFPASFFAAAWLFGTVGVCLIWLVLTPLLVAGLLRLTRGVTGIGVMDVLRSQTPVLAGVGFMVCCVLAVQWATRDDPRTAARLCAAVAAGVASYAGWMLLTARRTVLADVRGLWLELRGK